MKKKLLGILFLTLIFVGTIQPYNAEAAVELIPKPTSVQPLYDNKS